MQDLSSWGLILVGPVILYLPTLALESIELFGRKALTFRHLFHLPTSTSLPPFQSYYLSPSIFFAYVHIADSVFTGLLSFIVYYVW